jgi:hypothetical protein
MTTASRCPAFREWCTNVMDDGISVNSLTQSGRWIRWKKVAIRIISKVCLGSCQCKILSLVDDISILFEQRIIVFAVHNRGIGNLFVTIVSGNSLGTLENSLTESKTNATMMP